MTGARQRSRPANGGIGRRIAAGPRADRSLDEVSEPHLTRRLLLAGIGSAAVATGLSGCDRPPDQAPPPAQADQPRRATPRPTLKKTPKINEALLRRKIASLLVVGFRGDTVGKNDWIMKAIGSGLGGVILFDRELHTNAPRNITSPKQ